jgi:hypothetical protein
LWAFIDFSLENSFPAVHLFLRRILAGVAEKFENQWARGGEYRHKHQDYCENPYRFSP